MRDGLAGTYPLGPNLGPNLPGTDWDRGGLPSIAISEEANKSAWFETLCDVEGLAYAISKSGVSCRHSEDRYWRLEPAKKVLAERTPPSGPIRILSRFKLDNRLFRPWSA